MAKKSALGKGLGALLSDAAEEAKPRGTTSSALQEELKLSDIRPNPNQPRTVFDEEALQELASSIKAIGIVQPITVREVEDGKYEIVAGERRFRASKMAGLETIPAYIRKVEEESVLELALIENIQREDLNALEIAISYERLIGRVQLEHQDALSERVGKKRTTISNYLRLLKLPRPDTVGNQGTENQHGACRAIINIEDPETQYMVFEQIMKYDFSVRKVEEIVRELMKPEEEKERKAERKRQPIEDYMELQTHLARYFDTKVDLKRNEKGRGKIVISFKSDSDLERIVELLDKVDKK